MQLGLSINIPYILFTKGDSIHDTKVIISGIQNWDKVQEVAYNVVATAINEKVISEELTDDLTTSSTEAYMKTRLFYICQEIDDQKTETGKIYVVWDDIVDFVRTTALETEYKYYMNILAKASLKSDINQVVSKINAFVVTEFGGDVEAVFTQFAVVNGADKTEVTKDDLDKQKLEEAMAIVYKLASVKQIERLIDSLQSGKFADNLEEIKNTTEVILETTQSISSIIT